MHSCPRCRRANPDEAAFCYHDGIPLVQFQDSTQSRALEWTFPSGRRCTTIDELARGSLAEWGAARHALRTGKLRDHFADQGRADLARLAQDATAERDEDIALQTLIENLPDLAVPVRSVADPVPRRLNAEAVYRNEVRLLPLKFVNRGQGYLHGTVSVVGGERWLWLGDGISPVHTCWIGTRSEQTITVQIDPTMLPTVGSYLGKIRVESNGGNLEIPVQANLVNRAGTFRGHPISNEKELAILLRDRPRDAVGWLKKGDVKEWYAENGLTYPVMEDLAPELAGVQQFFEAAKFSRPPEVQLRDEEISAVCLFPEIVSRAVELTTHEKKWIYVFAQSDAMWLKPAASVFAGPQAALVRFDIDSGLLEAGKIHEGSLRLTANGGQPFEVKVRAEVRRPPTPFSRRLLRPFRGG